MTGLGHVIAASAARRDAIGSVVDRLIFGADEPEAVAAQVDEFCRRELTSGIAAYELYAVSIQSVHGVRLVDGRRVVVKAVQPRYRDAASIESMHAVQAVQAALVDAGFPAPRPLLGPRPLGASVATVEWLVDAGPNPVDGHEPGFRRAMAEALAAIVAQAAAFRDDTRLRVAVRPRGHATVSDIAEPGGLWPTPHSPLFDFEATTPGAGAIDALATEAQVRLIGLDDAPMVVGHFDVRAENCRYDGERIVAVFDWDSLGRAPEVEVAGSVAHAFPVDWSRDQVQAPAPEEMTAFLDDYEVARGAPFTRDERGAAAAVAAYAVAYTARCQHALGPMGNGNRSYIDLVDEVGRDLFRI